MTIDLIAFAQCKKNSAHKKHWENCVLAAPWLLACGVLGTSYFFTQGFFSWSLTGLGLVAGLLLVAANVLLLLERESESYLLLVCSAFSYPLFDLLGSNSTGMNGKAEMLYCLAGGAMGFGVGFAFLDGAMQSAVKRHDAVMKQTCD